MPNDKKWSVRIEDASSPMEVIFNASDVTVIAEEADRIKDEYRGNEVVEVDDLRKYGRIVLTPVQE
jgi:hypothetical protein